MVHAIQGFWSHTACVQIFLEKRRRIKRSWLSYWTLGCKPWSVLQLLLVTLKCGKTFFFFPFFFSGPQSIGVKHTFISKGAFFSEVFFVSPFWFGIFFGVCVCVFWFSLFLWSQKKSTKIMISTPIEAHCWSAQLEQMGHLGEKIWRKFVTVDGWNPVPVEVGSLSHCLHGCIHSRRWSQDSESEGATSQENFLCQVVTRGILEKVVSYKLLVGPPL